ncbi:MAG: hypothetical protein KatS3mg092_0369 [Patescibacteria group bacterium]|nr:MAG: hypothetical protein KatS3mg092_0369 [Patescibacteria group bacterium]
MESFKPYQNETLLKQEKVFQGPIETVRNIPSLAKNPVTGEYEKAEFNRFLGHVEYPPQIIEAIAQILNDYNCAFSNVLGIRQPEGSYPLVRFDGNFINLMVQVDMAGLPLSLLEQTQRFSPEELYKLLAPRIFEIENSLAMYNLMRGFGSPDNGEDPNKPYSPLSFFGVNFDSCLETLKEYFGKGIFLGTATDAKYEAMATSEFGVFPNDLLNMDSEQRRQWVKLLSGFGGFLSPDGVKKMLGRNVALYMRTSYPKTWLIHPGKNTPYNIPLLEDDKIRGQLRKLSITPNIDDPRVVNFIIIGLQNGSLSIGVDENGIPFIGSSLEMTGGFYPQIINDTKEYFAYMGFPIVGHYNLEAVEEFIRNSPNFRFKPLWLHYGCYGHLRPIDFEKQKDFMGELKRNMKMRGPYIIQPEIPAYHVNDPENGEFEIIHRLFFGFDPKSGRYKFIGGLYDALPADSNEAKKGRLHGNKQAVWGQIICTDPNIIVNPGSLNYVSSQEMQLFQ